MTAPRPDPKAAASLRAACDAINAEVAAKRSRLLKTLLACIGIVLVAAWMHVAYIWPATIGALGIFLFVGGRMWSAVNREFKAALAERIVPLLRPGLAFRPEGTLGLDDFRALGVFDGDIDNADSEDEVRGSRNGVDYSVQEAHATRTERSGSGKNRRTRTVTVFRGAVVMLEFNKHFAGQTTVVPESIASSLFGGLFSGGDRQAVKLENPDFERAFRVRSTAEQEARYLLTPRFMELVLEARAHFGDDLRLAFHDNILVVFMAGTGNRFQVSLFDGVTPGKTLTELDEVVSLAERLIDTFDLETRIWTRA